MFLCLNSKLQLPIIFFFFLITKYPFHAKCILGVKYFFIIVKQFNVRRKPKNVLLSSGLFASNNYSLLNSKINHWET